MPSINNASRTRFAAAIGFFVFLGVEFDFCSNFDRDANVVRAADSVRAAQANASGAPEETTFEGKIAAISPDEIVLATDDGATRSIPSGSVVWAQFDGEPLELSAARTATEIGEYEETLEKIAAISASDRKNAPQYVAQEIDWLQAEATARLALAGSEKLENAGRLLTAFLKRAPTHYRFYDANELVGEILTKLGKPADAAKYFEKLADAKSPATQARGKIALADVALLANELDRAASLFAEVADAPLPDSAESDAARTLESSNVRTLAKIGAARVLSKQGRFDDAEKALDDVLAQTSNDATLLQAKIYNAQGADRAAAGKTKEAIVSYLHVELLYSAARAERVEALRALVPLWRQDGRNDRADAAKKTLEERFRVVVP